VPFGLSFKSMFVSPPDVAILTALDVAALVISNSFTADVSVCNKISSLPLASAIKPPSVNLGAVSVLPLKVCVAVLSVIALVFDKSVEAIVIEPLPSNDCPAILTADANAVAVSALPVTSPVILPVNVPAIAPVPVIVD